MVRYSDNEIEKLVKEAKVLPDNYNSIKFEEVRGSKQRKLTKVMGKHGHQFEVIFRQSTFNNLDFSITLGIYPPNSNKLFRLKRYDGKHEHTNPIERERFYNFHIHTATERYQIYGRGEEDKYAQETNMFADLSQAWQCMLKDCNFIKPNESQLELNLFS